MGESFLTKEAIYKYIKEQYGTEPEYLWKRDPNSAYSDTETGNGMLCLCA